MLAGKGVSDERAGVIGGCRKNGAKSGSDVSGRGEAGRGWARLAVVGIVGGVDGRAPCRRSAVGSANSAGAVGRKRGGNSCSVEVDLKRGVGRCAGVGGGSAARFAAALIENSCGDGAASSCSVCSSVAATSESACCEVSLMLAVTFSAEMFGQLERTRRATHRVARRGSDSDRADTPAAARDKMVATGASPCAGCPASC